MGLILVIHQDQSLCRTYRVKAPNTSEAHPYGVCSHTSAIQVRRSEPCAAMHSPIASLSSGTRCSSQRHAACSAASWGASAAVQGRTAKGARSRCASVCSVLPLQCRQPRSELKD